MSKDRYVLVVTAGSDTLHRNPMETCNTDDARHRENVDPDTADALLTTGTARKCQHCWPDEGDAA